jgi:N-acetylglutamate synthase-like GNAT family acetyltransferase
MNVRTATANDIEKIQQLAHEIWPTTYYTIVGKTQVDYMLAEIYNTKKMNEQFLNQKHTFFLLMENEESIGYAELVLAENETIKLSKIYVLPQLQGKGTGTFFLNELITHAKKLGSKTILLNVNRFNNAKTFYEKMGFVIVEEIDIPFGEFWLNDYIMQKSI